MYSFLYTHCNVSKRGKHPRNCSITIVQPIVPSSTEEHKTTSVNIWLFDFLDLDECSAEASPCSGSCINTEGSFSCACPVGYTGELDNCIGKKKIACENPGFRILMVCHCKNDFQFLKYVSCHQRICINIIILLVNL